MFGFWVLSRTVGQGLLLGKAHGWYSVTASLAKKTEGDKVWGHRGRPGTGRKNTWSLGQCLLTSEYKSTHFIHLFYHQYNFLQMVILSMGGRSREVMASYLKRNKTRGASAESKTPSTFNWGWRTGSLFGAICCNLRTSLY